MERRRRRGYSASLVDLSAIALPSLPFISQTRSASPVNNISRQQRTVLGHRRASQPFLTRLSARYEFYDMIMDVDTLEVFNLHKIIILFEICTHQLGWRSEPPRYGRSSILMV